MPSAALLWQSPCAAAIPHSSGAPAGAARPSLLGKQELWRAHYVSPPKSSLAPYSSQQPAQGAGTELQSSQRFARELSFVPGAAIRLESVEASCEGQKSWGLSFLLDHFQLLSRFLMQIPRHIKKSQTFLAGRMSLSAELRGQQPLCTLLPRDLFPIICMHSKTPNMNTGKHPHA